MYVHKCHFFIFQNFIIQQTLKIIIIIKKTKLFYWKHVRVLSLSSTARVVRDAMLRIIDIITVALHSVISVCWCYFFFLLLHSEAPTLARRRRPNPVPKHAICKLMFHTRAQFYCLMYIYSHLVLTFNSTYIYIGFYINPYNLFKHTHNSHINNSIVPIFMHNMKIEYIQ